MLAGDTGKASDVKLSYVEVGEGESCKTCKYFRSLENGHNQGDCLRYPPCIGNGLVNTGDMWCGEYKKRNKTGGVYCHSEFAESAIKLVKQIRE